MKNITKEQMKEKLVEYIKTQALSRNVSVDQAKANRIIEEALQCDKPIKYVSSCLWRMEINNHRKQVAEVRADVRRAKVQEKFNKEKELATRTKEILEEIEMFMCVDRQRSHYWEALKLSILQKKGWATSLCAKHGANTDTVYQWKRRALLALKKRRPDLAIDGVIVHVRADG